MGWEHATGCPWEQSSVSRRFSRTIRRGRIFCGGQLEDVAATAKPDTILGWYRKLIANKYDGSKLRRSIGRPKVDQEAERLVLQMARENPSWGYTGRLV